MIQHGDKSHAPLGEQAVQITLHQLHIAGKAGLRFGKDDLKFPLPRVV